ncbi:MAG: B12-binding domain-containing radical SAM protein [Desulfatibacillaceae bacterium]
MKIALIIPRNSRNREKSFYDYKFISDFTFSKKHFSYLLAVPVLMSLTPPQHEIRVFDENVEDIDYDWPADVVGITVRTMFATRAYEISEAYRKRGVKTVLGGIHPSMRPEEAAEHGDAVVVGEAEHVWPGLLKDVENGRLERVYKSQRPTELSACPGPVRKGLSLERYFSDIVQTTKGCPFSCEFCSVHAYDGRKMRHKTVDQVVREVVDLAGASNGYKKKAIFFADDNIIGDRQYARQLFAALAPHNLNWSCQASIDLAKEDELLSMMKESGCGAVLVGLETVSRTNLAAMGKNVNLAADYQWAVEKIHSHGILVQGSFIMGYDFDTPEAFDELLEFIEEARLLMPLINVLTPLPGTRLFDRLESEGRILHNRWDEYDSQTVVFKPKGMEPEALADEYRRVLRSIYSFRSIHRKLKYYWDSDFWRHSNRVDPVPLKYRLLFAVRLASLLFSTNLERSRFILKILPRVFSRRVRVSTILALMAYNDVAYAV